MNYQSNTLRLMRPHRGGQMALYLHPARFQVVACGRRWGKTEFGKLAAIEMMLKKGEDVWWISPTYKMSMEIWRDFRKKLASIAKECNSTERRMELLNGAVLTIWTGSQADTMRGGSPALAIIDEAAMINDDNMWYGVVRPALTRPVNKRPGKALILSTPKGRNWFWKLFVLGQDKSQKAYKSWNFPSVYAPFLDQHEIDEAKENMPEMFFRQEYLAEFIDDAGTVFRGVNDVSIYDAEKPRYGRFVFGVDWGKNNDFTVISVFDIDLKKQVDIDRFNKIGWNFQRRRIKAMYDKWKPGVILAEGNSIGGPNIEALQGEGLPVVSFDTNQQTKPPLIEDLSLAIERGNIKLLNDRTQIAELQSYEMERLPSGKFKYNAPSGMHDDTVIATALAWHAIVNRGVKIIDQPDWLQNYR